MEGNGLRLDREAFRHAVGHLASGVTIVTCAAAGRRYGLTASSVTSVSLDPPTMLVCINRAAPTAAAVARAGAFAVNVLGLGQEELAVQFSVPSSDKFHDVGVRSGRTGAPLLDRTVANFECEVIETVTGGTHTVYLGRVLSAHAQGGEPLTYFRGGFGRFFPADTDLTEASR